MSSDSAAPDVNISIDALIIGAGFGGVHQLIHLRSLGLSTKIFEAGSDFGGIWYWNCYPGARVDSDLPIYQLSLPSLYKTWNYKEKFPGWKELREYFHHVDQTLDLSKDVYFNSRVSEAEWDGKEDRWVVKTEDGKKVAKARFLLLCTGIGSKYYIPDLKGLSSFKGIMHHTARWPQEGVDVKGKRVGIIGTGATGVQVIQELAPDVGHLTVFQRTPNMALPMQQGQVTAEMQESMKAEGLYTTFFKRCRQTFGGFAYDLIQDKSALDVSPEERRLLWENLFEQGGFRFWLANYGDMFTSQQVNDECYAFWRDKVRARLNDERMKEKLAPMVKPHPIGCKRPSLEQRYYEVYNQDNVTLVDINETPIDEITPKGIRTKDGTEYEFDILVLATGFDIVTGGITAIKVKGTDGEAIGDKWKNGVYTYLGMTTATYPNMFFLYGPQGPTSFCNGPSCAEMQGEWIVNCIKHMLDNGYSRIEAQKEAENKWKEYVLSFNERTLFPLAKSWYMGANIPGKPVEPLNFTGGVPFYNRYCNGVVEKGYEGFEFAKEPVTAQGQTA
ncbi:hypothetical protein D9758_005630 [Tetrapyrgos nigripes]|uniref:FAD/NAD(P)-binding domain-containing protein n=1 Tax=Tetrapyrgos nigripes TaxID=182062 RepID=A0A8H5GH13_9AGAR|nr:hypothetical protein D9758_005630 [Tetrapyrgos nigripes]